MANLQEVIQQIQKTGNIDPTLGSKNKQSSWEKTLAQPAMAQKSDPQTMAGFALGKLLRGGFDTWLENYKDRGDRKAAGKINEEAAKSATDSWAKENLPQFNEEYNNRDFADMLKRYGWGAR